eukprot:scaffold513_cov169-Amphora_coffeaeformis.AAC.6
MWYGSMCRVTIPLLEHRIEVGSGIVQTVRPRSGRPRSGRPRTDGLTEGVSKNTMERVGQFQFRTAMAHDVVVDVYRPFVPFTCFILYSSPTVNCHNSFVCQ